MRTFADSSQLAYDFELQFYAVIRHHLYFRPTLVFASEADTLFFPQVHAPLPHHLKQYSQKENIPWEISSYPAPQLSIMTQE